MFAFAPLRMARKSALEGVAVGVDETRQQRARQAVRTGQTLHTVLAAATDAGCGS